MFQIAYSVAVLLVLTLVSGCASVGNDFSRLSVDRFQVRTTRYAEVLSSMGRPRKIEDLTENGKSVRAITFEYATTMGQPSEDGVTPGRTAVFYFHDDKLVGKEFVSSFKTDSTMFDDSKVSGITKGTSTRANVIDLLGQPASTFVWPMTNNANTEVLGYVYKAFRGEFLGVFKNFSKFVKISLDMNGIVSDIEHWSGNL